jgi:hypothetical protein
MVDTIQRKTPPDNSPGSSATPAVLNRPRQTSMHDGIAVWCDCCSCEAEPYWQEVAEDLGIDLGSNYQDDSG